MLCEMTTPLHHMCNTITSYVQHHYIICVMHPLHHMCNASLHHMCNASITSLCGIHYIIIMYVNTYTITSCVCITSMCITSYVWQPITSYVWQHHYVICTIQVRRHQLTVSSGREARTSHSAWYICCGVPSKNLPHPQTNNVSPIV